MNLEFQYPEFFLLLIPLLWIFWKGARQESKVIATFRFLLLVLFIFALAHPLWKSESKKRTLILLFDRSASLPDNANLRAHEIIKIIKNNKESKDRLGIVSFGQGAMVEAYPQENLNFSEFIMKSNQPASDLGEGLDLAQKLLSGQPGKIIVITDGKYTGRQPRQVAMELGGQKVKVDYRYLAREIRDEIALAEVSFPDQVDRGKPFQYSLWIEANRAVKAKIVVSREGEKIAQVERNLQLGRNRLFFRDLIKEGGSFLYKVRISSENDQIVENNRGIGVVRVQAPPRLLAITPEGRRDNLTRALKKSGIPLDVLPPAQVPHKLSGFDRYRAVIIENIPASDLQGRLKILRTFVEDLGGGLLMTGGKSSFGLGGYYKSPLEEALPVSMELRKEHHKLKVAICVALDRSGSMGATVPGGKTKMDLANMGTIEVVDLLSPYDEIAVVAVDTSPHEVISLQKVANPAYIKSKISAIQSRGGGIYTLSALDRADSILALSKLQTRHVLLFADASDAEEQKGCQKLVKSMVGKGITLSVIALGNSGNRDAAFLEKIAKEGNGRCFFASKASDLPRLFAQETLTIAKSSFIEEKTSAKVDPELYLLSSSLNVKFPTVGGYNLTYIRPRASTGLISQDEYSAPLFAFWYRGTGRAAAFTPEVDGKYSGNLQNWGPYGDFFVTIARWLMGKEAPSDVYVSTERKGAQGFVYVEMEDPQALPPRLVILSPSGKKREATFTIYDEGYRAQFPLDEFGIYFPLLHFSSPQGQKNQRIMRCPPLTLPYPAEFLPQVQNQSGKENLAEIAKITQGKEALQLDRVAEDLPFSLSFQSLNFWLFLSILFLLILEIGLRRLGLAGLISAFFVKIWKELPEMKKRSKSKKQYSTKPKPSGKEKESPSQKREKAEERESSQTSSLFKKAKKQARDRLED